MEWDIKLRREVRPPDGSKCDDCKDVIYGEVHVQITELDLDKGTIWIHSDRNPDGDEWILCKDCREKWDEFEKKINS